MKSHDASPEPPLDGLRSREFLWIAVAVFAIMLAGRFVPYSPVQDFFGNFNWLTEQALKLAERLYGSYGYLVVFFSPLVENTLFLGALIPGTLLMLLAGLSAHDGLIALGWAYPLGIAGAIIGDTISYGIGRFGFQRLGPESRLVRWSEETREALLDQGIWLVLSYHFAGYSRMIGPAAAGFMRMPLRRWMLLDYAGVTVWVVCYITLGYVLGVFGLSLDDSDRNVRVFEILLFVLFILGVLAALRATGKRSRMLAEQRGEAEALP
jgi:membrane protein DedA with SNARE-associated domain